MKTNPLAVVLFVLGYAAIAAGAQGLPAQKPGTPAVAPPAGEQAKIMSDKTAGMELVFVKGGCFQMGDVFGGGNNDEKPVHDVCVADFYMGKHEVTQAQWQKVMGENPSSNKQCGPDCPVESVSWNDAQEFIKKLNAKSGKQFRLPTEAEWEYAARSGGRKEKWPGTNDEAKLDEYAWYSGNNETQTQRVGTKKPNALGLFDMAGNIREWCQDWYGDTYYQTSPKDNPSGPATGEKRVLRGGDWDDLRTTKRGADGPPDVRDNSNGLRILLPAP